MASKSFHETKQGDTNIGPYLSYLVQPNLHGKPQRLPSLLALWILIFSYSGPTAYEITPLRCLCKLFYRALKPLQRRVLWTSFPHPKYSTLQGLFDRINELSRNSSTNIPKLVLIDNGVHVIDGRYVEINIPISIIGESREYCIVMGGLSMNGKKEDDVNVSDLTLRESKSFGVLGCYGPSIHLDNVSVENSGHSGVWVYGSKRNTMKNCNVSHSTHSGLFVGGGGLMTIDGNATTIHHNCTRPDCWTMYELYTASSSSSIHLVSPLTLDLVSYDNGGRNSGGTGTIKTL